MPGLEKIHLEDALEDNPQTRSMVSLFEQDADLLREYVEVLRSHCEKVLNAQKELASATSSLSQHLRAYENQRFPLDTDPDSVLKTTLKEFADTLDEVSSLQQVCAAQLGDGMLYPINRFIDADLSDIFTMMEIFASASNEMEQSVTKFCKCSKKRDSEKVRQEVNEEVYMATKKYHQTALHYYASMNALQYKRKIALLEPILGYLHAIRSTFSVGQETVNTPELETFLTNIGTSIQGVQTEMGLETQKTVELIDTIEQQSKHLYYAEPPSDMPYIPPNTGLSQKNGYLFLKTKFAGMVTKWEHVFVYTLGSKLMTMSKGDLAGSVLLELDKTATTVPLENEDRRNVFQVTNGKKSVVLQALNARERDEWISSIHNIAKDIVANRSLTRQCSKDRSSRQNTVEKSLSASSNTSSTEGDAKLNNPASSPSTPVENLLLETPIQFDLFSPAEDRERSQSMDPPEDSTSDKKSVLSDDSGQDNSNPSPFWEVFAVRFLGSMQVQKDRGDYLVYQTIRHIMAARAIHNIFKTNESHMVITHRTLKILDPSHQAIRAYYLLEDVSFWTTHKENNRLLGFITRSKIDPESKPSFHCHVFEAQPSADEICTALSKAANIALSVLLEKTLNSTEDQNLDSVADPKNSSSPEQNENIPREPDKEKSKDADLPEPSDAI
ncbi:DCC-interacting protein 13-alpha isoform X1 [Parasteatoda tepidariorum]|uniref:DCC-interacting protein 13-alpha isoform X1 n=1 Tax=Parasteatoda tepidariorum TaxID=114398 RepID=UPI000A2C0DD3|nr:DCC-interacting protein 13-alpha isoform X1 [Parasteatoda tepidariorum]XP_042905833.1 DCC-interacting protein 13-alpha isoform X1 [Parasteatoda tepidariorum]